jgi:hypothetical protein
VSETAPERPAPRRSSSGGTLELFKEKIGPLPMWVWVAIIAAGLIVYRLYADKKNASAASSPADSSVPADQVPEFINQTYTTVTAPASTPPPANGTTPPAKAPTPTPPSSPGKTGGPSAPAMPSGVKAGKVTSSSIAASWPKVAGATSYLVRVTYQNKLVKQETVKTPAATIAGLSPDHTYTVHVAAVGPGGTSPETNGPGIQTTR